VEDSSDLQDADLLGLCDYDKKTLHIPKEGTKMTDLDTIIHEALHACTELDEDAVDESATSIARLLWRLGWRKVNIED
jgi:hypothetical protein